MISPSNVIDARNRECPADRRFEGKGSMANRFDIGRAYSKIRVFSAVEPGTLGHHPFGIYGSCWYYFVNDELKERRHREGRIQKTLAQLSPAMSVVSILVGGWLIVPRSRFYTTASASKRCAPPFWAGLPKGTRINPTGRTAPHVPRRGLVIPTILHFWYVQA